MKSPGILQTNGTQLFQFSTNEDATRCEFTPNAIDKQYHGCFPYVFRHSLAASVLRLTFASDNPQPILNGC